MNMLLCVPFTKTYRCSSAFGVSIKELEEMLWSMMSPGELRRDHLKIIVKSMDPEDTGKVGLKELVAFVRARQGTSGSGTAAKQAETGLLR